MMTWSDLKEDNDEVVVLQQEEEILMKIREVLEQNEVTRPRLFVFVNRGGLYFKGRLYSIDETVEWLERIGGEEKIKAIRCEIGEKSLLLVKAEEFFS